MTLSLFRRTPTAPARRPKSTRPAFTLEGLEERVVMSHSTLAAPALTTVQVAPAAHAAPSVSVPINITGVNLTGLVTDVNNLVTGVTGTVSGTLNGLTLPNVPITISPAATSTPAVPVLSLHLSPIDLNVLGLEVKTSDICLNITAQTGTGNLLGNLVAGLANALNGTQSAAGTGLLTGLNNLINSITGTVGTATSATGALNSLISTTTTGATGTGSSSVTGLLNSALGQALGQTTPSAASPTSPLNIVHLSVGPLNLNLLGLVVNLDNCNNGPVTVDVNALPGPGNLLGNLLADVAHLLDGPGLHLGQLRNLDNAILALIRGH